MSLLFRLGLIFFIQKKHSVYYLASKNDSQAKTDSAWISQCIILLIYIVKSFRLGRYGEKEYPLNTVTI